MLRSLFIRTSTVVILGLCLRYTTLVLGVDFIRGDANGDGVVTFSDEFRIWGFLTGRFDSPDCMRSADVNDDEVIEMRDVYYLSNYLFGTNESPPAPFPVPGPDLAPTAEIDCQNYGGGSPLHDPAAEIHILDVDATGGSFSSLVALRIAISNTSPVAGFYGRVRIEGAVIGSLDGGQPRDGDLTGSAEQVSVGLMEDGKYIQFSDMSRVVFSPDSTNSIQPGIDVPVLEIYACLNHGTPAGVYSLTLESAEIIDAETARAIYPKFRDGNLTVLSDVKSIFCSRQPPPPEPKASLELVGGNFSRGGSFEVPLIIHSDSPVQGYSFSVDFDETVLRAHSIEAAWRRPDGQPNDFEFYEINNENNFPGSRGVDEGFVVGSVVFDFEGSDFALLPANTDNPILKLVFQAQSSITDDSTQISFIDGGRAQNRSPTSNTVTVNGAGIDLELLNAVIHIDQGAAGTFIRGDANSDGLLDISDPIAILEHLFTGSQQIVCPDAADANDDGTVDISDPIRTLEYLFLGSEPLPAPNGPPGEDPTSDGLSSCLN